MGLGYGEYPNLTRSTIYIYSCRPVQGSWRKGIRGRRWDGRSAQKGNRPLTLQGSRDSLNGKRHDVDPVGRSPGRDRRSFLFLHDSTSVEVFTSMLSVIEPYAPDPADLDQLKYLLLTFPNGYGKTSLAASWRAGSLVGICMHKPGTLVPTVLPPASNGSLEVRMASTLRSEAHCCQCARSEGNLPAPLAAAICLFLRWQSLQTRFTARLPSTTWTVGDLLCIIGRCGVRPIPNTSTYRAEAPITLTIRLPFFPFTIQPTLFPPGAASILPKPSLNPYHGYLDHLHLLPGSVAFRQWRMASR